MKAAGIILLPYDYCRTLCNTFAGCSSALPAILLLCKCTTTFLYPQMFLQLFLQFRICQSCIYYVIIYHLECWRGSNESLSLTKFFQRFVNTFLNIL